MINQKTNIQNTPMKNKNHLNNHIKKIIIIFNNFIITIKFLKQNTK